MGVVNGARAAVRRVEREYAPAEARPPLRGYATAIGAYLATVGVLTGVARLTGRRAPDRVSVTDVALMALATHKLSRTITKDAVTSPLRAPFTRFEGPAGEAELNERVRAHGVGHAVGELLTCPFCSAVWVATGLSAGAVFAPGFTRLVTTAASAVAGADFLHLAYDAAKKLVG